MGGPAVFALRRGVVPALPLLVLVCCTACGGGEDDPFDSPSDTGTAPDTETDPAIPPVTSGTWYRPPVTTTWQWQLQGDVNIGYDVALYELDLVEGPASVIAALKASGRRLLCYFSAGSWEDFRPDAGQFPSSALGSVYVADASARNAMCAAARGRGLQTLVLPEDSDDSFRFSCDST